MTTADEKKWSPENVRGKFILTCVVKTGVVKHVEYYQNLRSAIKSEHSLQSVNNESGECI